MIAYEQSIRPLLQGAKQYRVVSRSADGRARGVAGLRGCGVAGLRGCGVAVLLDVAGNPAAGGQRSLRPGRLRDLTH